jgi:hypothetical protein
MDQEEINLSWRDQFFISPAGQWVDQHRNFLLNIGLFVLIVMVWGIVKIAHTPNMDAIRHSEEAYTAWKANPADEQLFQTFIKALKKSPELRQKMSGDIAQALLVEGRIDEAEELAKSPLSELRSIAPEYAEFSEISFLIARKHYQEALEKSVSLKEKLSEQSRLWSQNLVRIAILQQQLGNSAGELAAWREFDRIDSPAGLALKEPSVHFQAYVAERKKTLDQLVSTVP